MTNTAPAVPTPPAKTSALRYFSCLRPQDILVLQGPPLLGAAFAILHPSMKVLGAFATLMLANILLIAHVFMLNDWSGLTTDLADPNRARVFTAGGVGRKEMGALTAGLLVLSLLFFSPLGPVTLALAIGIALLSGLYSLPRFNWKGRPFLNSLAHISGGILHFLLGYSLGHAIDQRGVAIALFFALIFTAGHLTQEVRDHEGDAANSIMTNAVLFGPRRTFLASLILFAMAQIVLLALSFDAILPRPFAVLVALFPLQLWWSRETLTERLSYASVCRLQTRYRALYAVVGLLMVAALCVRQ